MRISFEVDGLPQPQGSTKAFKTKSGKVLVTSDNRKLKPWRQAVIAAAREQLGRTPPATGAVRVDVVFNLPRPLGHFGKRGLLPSAPELPIVRPDLDKLCRAVLDALTEAGVFRDDGQVWKLELEKQYGDHAGAAITVASRDGTPQAVPVLPGMEAR